jgi:kinesin family protein 11
MADLDTAFGAFAALASLLSTSLDSGHADIRDAASAVLGIKEELQANVRAWAEGVRTRSASTIHAQLREQTSAVGSVLDSTDTLLQDVIAAARDNLEAQGATFRRVHEISEAQKDAELARLQEQNALLANLLAEEQAKSARLRSSLVENVTRMITDFTEQRDASLRTAIGDLQHSNAERLRVADQSPYEGVLGVSTQAADTFGAELEQYSAAVDGQRSVGRKALGDVVKLQRRVEDDASEAAAEAEEHAQAVDGFCGRIGAAATQGTFLYPTATHLS